MTNPGRYLVVLLLVTVCTAGLNTYHCLVDGAEQPESLIVYLGATHVRFSKRGSTNQVTYHVGAKFPATAVIDWISEKLKETGWKPLARDFLSPNLSSSEVRVWEERLAGLKEPDICLRQWIGDWTDSSGNIVRYAFRYKEPCSSHDSTDLEVFAGYIPQVTVRQLETAVEQLRQKLKAK